MPSFVINVHKWRISYKMQKSYAGVNVFSKTIPILGKRVYVEQDPDSSLPVSHHDL